jgi:uncharacterized protein (DUF1697 family)
VTVHIALLRGVNVGGNKMVAMSDLRDLLAKLGFADARTLLQSGNLVFRSDARTGAALERLLEAEAKKRLGIEADFLVRTAKEWKAVIARNPFPAEAERDPSRLVVTFLRDAPDEPAVESLRSAIVGPEVVRADGRHLYVVYPNGMGRSKLTHALLEKRLGTRGTARNWNTVLKLGALADA